LKIHFAASCYTAKPESNLFLQHALADKSIEGRPWKSVSKVWRGGPWLAGTEVKQRDAGVPKNGDFNYAP
jgi:hypothetical protein